MKLMSRLTLAVPTYLHVSFSLAAICWSFHYAKRLLETLFVHRFSNATMPVMNLFKNCGYYWGFAAYVAYHVNHPLYTTPGKLQIYAALASFAVRLDLSMTLRALIIHTYVYSSVL